MLLRMYVRWAEQHATRSRCSTSMPARRPASSRATIQVKGHNAYGWLKTESGVHRLVRISPYDANARRHTSFAASGSIPVVDDSIDIEVNEERLPDRHLSRFRRRRPARQHDRFGGAHHPSPDRHRRRLPERALAAQEPRHRLEDAQGAALRDRAGEAQEKIDAANAKKTDIGWGHQIRSYVLQPYQLVKDLRTGVDEHQPVRRARRRPRRVHGGMAGPARAWRRQGRGYRGHRLGPTPPDYRISPCYSLLPASCGEGKRSEAAPVAPHFPFSPSFDGEKSPEGRMRDFGCAAALHDGASPRLPSCFPEKSPSSAPPGHLLPLRGAKGKWGRRPSFCRISEEGGAARGAAPPLLLPARHFPFSPSFGGEKVPRRGG